jgi:hypothetical protein
VSASTHSLLLANDTIHQQLANAQAEVTCLLDANHFLLTVNSGDANMYANMYEHVLKGKDKRATEQVEAFQALEEMFRAERESSRLRINGFTDNLKIFEAKLRTSGWDPTIPVNISTATDGSVTLGVGYHSWIVATEEEDILLQGGGPDDGDLFLMQSYRSDLGGVAAGLAVLGTLSRSGLINIASTTFLCDNDLPYCWQIGH